jgi:endonuclease YncB( thermonuclease family)
MKPIAAPGGRRLLGGWGGAEKPVRVLVLAALVLALADALPAPALSSGPRLVVQRGTVTVIVDPVTIGLRLNDGSGERAQLIGLAAPAVDSCAFSQAKADINALAGGRPVWLAVVQKEPPRHGLRVVLGYAILPGGLDLGLELIKRGDATVRTDQPPFKSLAAYISAQATAQASSLGLWACSGGSSSSPAPASSASLPPDTPGPGPSDKQDHTQQDHTQGPSDHSAHSH